MSTDKKSQIRPATLVYGNLDEDYKMSAKPRGECLIINNVDFENNIFAKRVGSDKDAHDFKLTFVELGFEVDSRRNLTSEDMRKAFKRTSMKCNKRHDALIVILLSHGTEDGIYGIDCIEIDLNDILNYFDNKRCRDMVGKPKVFIVQACRGRKADYGIQTFTCLSQTDTQPSQITQTSQDYKLKRWSEGDKKGLPTRSDMLLCFSCHIGFNSNRNEADGSWLGSSLIYYIRQEAYHHHVIDILNHVSRDLKKRKSSDGYKQVLEITSIGFDKHLFFNPGYFPDIKSKPTLTNTNLETENDKKLALELDQSNSCVSP